MLCTLIFVSCGGPKVDYSEFAQCLTDEGMVMYGAFWCPHCNDQKAEFGSAVKLINYVECDPKGENGQPELCLAMNVESYPTWIRNEVDYYKGFLKLEKLAEITSCELPKQDL